MDSLEAESDERARRGRLIVFSLPHPAVARGVPVGPPVSCGGRRRKVRGRVPRGSPEQPYSCRCPRGVGHRRRSPTPRSSGWIAPGRGLAGSVPRLPRAVRPQSVGPLTDGRRAPSASGVRAVGESPSSARWPTPGVGTRPLPGSASVAHCPRGTNEQYREGARRCRSGGILNLAPALRGKYRTRGPLAPASARSRPAGAPARASEVRTRRNTHALFVAPRARCRGDRFAGWLLGRPGSAGPRPREGAGRDGVGLLHRRPAPRSRRPAGGRR